MHRLTPRFVFAPNEDKGSDPAEEVTLTTEEEIAKIRAEMEAEKEKPEEKEEEEKEEPEKKEPEPEKKEPEPLTNEQILALAKERGIAVEKEPANTEEEAAEPPATPGFRAQAYADAKRYAKFLDEDGDLTQEGADWAEERAMVLHQDALLSDMRQKQVVQELQLQKPTMIENTVAAFTKEGMAEDMAKAVSADYIEILLSYGPAAFDDGQTETDPAIKAQKESFAKNLRTTAYYISRGKEADRQDALAKEGGDKGDAAHEKVTSGESGGSLWAGVSQSDKRWLETEWARTRNDGKPPTRKQIDELRKQEVID